MSECRLISRSLIPLSASGVASKPLCPYMCDVTQFCDFWCKIW